MKSFNTTFDEMISVVIINLRYITLFDKIRNEFVFNQRNFIQFDHPLIPDLGSISFERIES